MNLQKKLTLSITFIFISVIVYSQDTTFFDKNWKEIPTKNDASYYRIAQKKGNKWEIKDYYISGQLQMHTYHKNKLEDIKDGFTIFYYRNGNKSSEGNYINDKRDGLFKYYYENGQQKYLIYNKDEKEKYVQIWDIIGKAQLENGTGTYSSFNKKRNTMFYNTYRDSICIETYIIRESDKKRIHYLAEKQAEFDKGKQGFLRYLKKNLVYPKKARRRGLEGMVRVSFIINSDGTLSDFEITKSIGEECNQEAIRVLKMSSKRWNPATVNGKPVNQATQIPIIFRLR